MQRKGLSRLTNYVPSWRRVAVLSVVAAVGAAGPVIVSGALLVLLVWALTRRVTHGRTLTAEA